MRVKKIRQKEQIADKVTKAGADPQKFVDEFCSVPRKKLKRKVDLKKLYEEELEERLFRTLKRG